jgi:hypothetical protein
VGKSYYEMRFMDWRVKEWNRVLKELGMTALSVEWLSRDAGFSEEQFEAMLGNLRQIKAML